jgi:endogenous inhibitor of DNA gyrase (YacG/DUF329 family)
MSYVAPQRGLKAYTCPHCGAFARQHHASNQYDLEAGSGYTDNEPLATSICAHCENAVIWHEQEMVYPNRGSAPPPNPDMPQDVKQDYEEAARISSISPRGAAALLRLALQKLCVHLGGSGKNLNDDIGLLVKRGLSPVIQQSLDVVRVVGNNAVHPGQIDTDNPEVVSSLFILINVIVESMIAVPAKIRELYASLPEGALTAIQKRDGSTGSQAS